VVVGAIGAATRREARSDLTVGASERRVARLRGLRGVSGGGCANRVGACLAAEAVGPKTGRRSGRRREPRGHLARWSRRAARSSWNSGIVGGEVAK
jgi:hypothetical protein